VEDLMTAAEKSARYIQTKKQADQDILSKVNALEEMTETQTIEH
jgi:hypothetical protein